MDYRENELSPFIPEWWRSSPLPISLSAQRSLAVLKNLKSYPKYNPTYNPNNNSLKYLKLAPINSFSEIASPVTPSSPLLSPTPSSPILCTQQSLSTTSTTRRVSRCAFYSQKGETSGIPKEQNQDETLLIPKVNNVAHQFIFGVFDGHGPQGHNVSNFIKNKIKSSTSLLKDSTAAEDLREFLLYTINHTSKTVLSSNIKTKHSGSTLCLILISSNTLACANIGDSRCVIASQQSNEGFDVEAISKDHKPSDPDEACRVLKAGGIVDQNPFSKEKEGVLRVWTEDPSIAGLAMTRSIGDKQLKKVGVSSEPDIFIRKLTDRDKFVILASDGLWDVVEAQEAVRVINSTLKSGGHAKSACQALVELATLRWRVKGDCVDDISVILVLLNSKS